MTDAATATESFGGDEDNHSEVGASISHIFFNCPGSVQLRRGLPNMSSRFAHEGHVAHEAAATRIISGKWPASVDPEMMEWLQTYVDCVEGYIALADSWYVEQQFNLSMWAPGAFGTADFVAILKDGTLVVADLKYGQGIPVSAVGNRQLRYYALGAISRLQERGEHHVITRVKVMIVQPRAGEECIRSDEFSVDELYNFGFDLQHAVAETQKPNAPLQSGPWCQFCPAITRCHRLLGDLAAVVGCDNTSPAVWSIGIALMASDRVKLLIRRIEETAIALAMEGHKIPGHVLADKAVFRSYENETDAKAILEKALPGWDVTETSLLSPTKLETLVKKDKEAKQKLAEVLPRVLAVKVPGKTLKPIKHPGQKSSQDATFLGVGSVGIGDVF